MRTDILILGQGLAGTLLGWTLERAGVPFTIVDPGHERAASAVAAGIVNPITGRRLVKSWRIDVLLPLARATYSEIEAELGIRLWHELRIHRLFAEDRERRVFAQKRVSGELTPFIGSGDDTGFWIAQAARVDLPQLLARMRTRWLARGILRERAADARTESLRHDLVIDCTGLAAIRSAKSVGAPADATAVFRVGAADPAPPSAAHPWSAVPWEFSRGEMIEIAVEGLDPGVILNRGHWVLPVAEGRAWIGATHEPGVVDAVTTAAARAALERSAREIIGRPISVIVQRAGIRVNLPDKRAVAGRHPEHSRVGLINGLGAKGVLLAPFLARQWLNHLTEGVAFDPEIAVTRFVAHPHS